MYICITIHTGTVHRARGINNGTKFFVSSLRIVITVFQQSFKHLSTMNRTHLEGAAEALAAQQGYAFHTGPEDGMAHTMRSYPAAWLAPLELHAVEGRGHGRATYNMTLHLLSSGARLSPAERRTALARMEERCSKSSRRFRSTNGFSPSKGFRSAPAPSHSRRTAKSRRPPPRAS